MPLVSDVKYWIPVYLVGVAMLIRSRKIETIGIILFIVLAVTLADQISASYIKPWIDRARPCHTFDNINLLVGCGGGRSFPSAHSTNNFAVATFLTGLFPHRNKLWLGLAALVALSRVYNGVHYPIDITGGAFLGAAIGWWLYLLYIWIDNRFFSKKGDDVDGAADLQ